MELSRDIPSWGWQYQTEKTWIVQSTPQGILLTSSSHEISESYSNVKTEKNCLQISWTTPKYHRMFFIVTKLTHGHLFVLFGTGMMGLNYFSAQWNLKGWIGIIEEKQKQLTIRKFQCKKLILLCFLLQVVWVCNELFEEMENSRQFRHYKTGKIKRKILQKKMNY